MIRSMLLLVAFAHAGAVAAGLPPPAVEKINDRVYALLGPVGVPSPENEGYMVNSVLIVGDNGAVVVDTGFTHAIGEHLRAVIEGITDKPVTHVINTHHHGDHHLGNTAFPEAEIISSDKGRELIIGTEAEWISLVEGLTQMRFPDTRVVPATRTIPGERRTEVTLAGVDLVLWVPLGSHTPGDLMVVLPEDRVLITGDILVHGMMPNFRDAHVESWVQTLEEIGEAEVDVIVPGHGALMTPDDAAAMQRRMAAFYRDVAAGFDEGLQPFEIRERMDLSEWQDLRNFEDMLGGNLSRTFLEVEEARF